MNIIRMKVFNIFIILGVFLVLISNKFFNIIEIPNYIFYPIIIILILFLSVRLYIVYRRRRGYKNVDNSYYEDLVGVSEDVDVFNKSLSYLMQPKRNEIGYRVEEQDSGEDINVITSRTIRAFQSDMKVLGNLEPSIEPQATDHIPQMIKMIEKQILTGNAYQE